MNAVLHKGYGFDGLIPICDSEKEITQHIHAIESVSVSLGEPLDQVERVYDIVLKRYKRAARIKDFLPILVSRKVVSLFKARKQKGG
ncbi:MAG: DUF3562 domain-containing protein [Deltaproteobacteria bacterium]|nr:DUF3562 domain-containing protein [Deltaproteobacteria bacterium]